MGDLIKRQILTSTYMKSGRFGTALGKIGDVNKDGFNGELI